MVSDVETLRLGYRGYRSRMGITLPTVLLDGTSVVPTPLFSRFILCGPGSLSSMGFPYHSRTIYRSPPSSHPNHTRLRRRHYRRILRPPTHCLRRKMDQISLSTRPSIQYLGL